MSQLLTRIAESLEWTVRRKETGVFAGYFCLYSPAGKQRGGHWRNKADAWKQKLKGSPKIPNWLEDPAAALGLCEALRADGLRVTVGTGNGGWACLVYPSLTEGPTFLGTATGPHAFCKAICGAYAKAKSITLTEEKS